MVGADSPAGALPRAGAPAWLIPPGVLAVACGIALFLVPAEIRPTVAWCGLAATALAAAASAVATRRERAAEATRHTRGKAALEQHHARREAALHKRLADQHAAVLWLAEDMLPVALKRLRKNTPASEIVLATDFGDHLDPQFAGALRTALRRLLEAAEMEELTRDSSQRALVAIARRVQAIVHQLGKDLHDMQMVHGTDVVLAESLQSVDHRNALVGRLAASIAVLGDSRPGRQWQKPIALYDVIRGGMSRIVDFPRVQLQSVVEVGVLGRGAEPLMHLLAELLDNATTFSPPSSPVLVSASEVPTGVAIEIEDRGVGLTEEVRERIERIMADALDGRLDLSKLGETTQLGMPVISRLARDNNLVVDLRRSAYGGVRAVVLVPRDILTTVPAYFRRWERMAKYRFPPGAAAATATATDGVPDSAEGLQTSSGLPQRRRHTPVQTPIVCTSPTPPAPSKKSGPRRPPGLMWEAFKGVTSYDEDLDSHISEPSDKGE